MGIRGRRWCRSIWFGGAAAWGGTERRSRGVSRERMKHQRRRRGGGGGHPFFNRGKEDRWGDRGGGKGGSRSKRRDLKGERVGSKGGRRRRCLFSCFFLFFASFFAVGSLEWPLLSLRRHGGNRVRVFLRGSFLLWGFCGRIFFNNDAGPKRTGRRRPAWE